MAQLLVITGPIAAGKSTVASLIADRLTAFGRSAVLVDVDDVAATVTGSGAAAAGLWFAAHQAHGSLVGGWMRTAVDVVIAVGPIYALCEQAALLQPLPEASAAHWVVVDASVDVTLARAQGDPCRGPSREPRFHREAHQRFRRLLPGIPAAQTFDSERTSAAQIASAVLDAINVRQRMPHLPPDPGQFLVGVVPTRGQTTSIVADTGGGEVVHESGRTEPLPRQRPRWSELRPLVKVAVPARRSSRAITAASIDDLRDLARRSTPRAVFDYVDGAAEAELSYRRSRRAFDRIEFRPQVLRNVSATDTRTTLLGVPATMPLVLAPTGFTRMMHHQGEFAVAAAAAAAGVPYALSTMGTVSPERLSQARGNDGADRWFQLYLWRDRAASKELLARAAASGYRALVLTVDTPVTGARLRDVRNGLTIPPALTLRTLADMSRHPAWWFNLLTTEPLTFASLTSTNGALGSMVNTLFDPAADLDDLAWLRATWNGPLVVKGVQTAADARRVVDAGADAVVLSNHGGRQLDRAVTPLEELPAALDQVGDRAEIYLDGGVRSGADVIAAVALGARACLVGRAYLYGLMAGGQAGVTRALDILEFDMRRTLALLGTPTLADVSSDSVRLRSSP